jgi:hypothetical protein
MRTLRLVGPGRDPDRLLLETEDGLEQFELPVTADLTSGLRLEQPRLDPAGPALSRPELSRPEPSRLEPPRAEPTRLRPVAVPSEPLRPRDIQTRVRSGESPEQIAEQAGLALENVLRFAAPVLDERARVASEARRARARRNGGDGPLVVFGETVDARFAAHGIDPQDVSWDALRREDGQWVVTARWIGGDAERRADWAFTLSARTVTALDDAAADLLSDRPVRTVPPPPPPPPFVPHLIVSRPATPPPPAPAPAPAATHVAVAPEPEPAGVEPVPLRPAIDEPAVSSTAMDDTVVDISEPLLDVEPEPVSRRLQTADTDVVPSLPLGLPEPAFVPSRRREESDEERAERARIPSWDDILLGVRRKRD